MSAAARKGQSRRILVTGGAGFIGSHVADAHLRGGDRVWVLDDLSTGRRENVPDGAEFLEASIEDPDVLDLFGDVGFDLVSHHAAQIDVRLSVRDPERDARINVLGLLNILEAAKTTGVQRVVYISSGGVVYGEAQERPTRETAPKLPLSPYGVSKLAGEFYLNYYRRVHGLEYVALRYGNVYGPRQDPHGEAGVVAIFATRLLALEPLVVFGDGEQTRDYVYVGDVAAANLLACEMPLLDEGDLDDYAFNVGTEVGTSVNRLADVMESVSGRAPGRERAAPRRGELRHSALNTERLRSRGWLPRTSLEDGLRTTFNWVESSTSRGALEPTEGGS